MAGAGRLSRVGLIALLIVGAAVLVATAASSPEDFSDVAVALQPPFRLEHSPTTQRYLPETMGGGVAVFDFDNDGRPDIFFTNGAELKDPMPAAKTAEKSGPRFLNRLYHQNPDGTFTDVTARAGLGGSGYSMGVAVGDYDNDGYEDLFVTGLDRVTLYHNNGDGTFTDVTARSGTSTAGWTTSAGFFDYDNDGHLDLFVARYVRWSFDTNRLCGSAAGGRHYCQPLLFPGSTGVLYHNNGDGSFTDVSATSGIAGQQGRGLGVAFGDYDGDGRTDIYVANDSMESFLYHNDGAGKFTESGIGAGVAYDDDGNAFAGMGVDFADYDNDGLPDIVVTDLGLQNYMLFHNSGDGLFESRSDATGLAHASHLATGWGIRMADFDNDGWKDLIAAQGHTDVMDTDGTLHNFFQKPMLLRNRSARFEQWPGNTGGAFTRAWAGRGLATGDFDSDGALDVVVSNLGQSPYILHNNAGKRNHWIGIKPRGTRSNRDGIGCRIKVVSASGMTQYYTVNTASSYLSASDRRVIAGLGGDNSARLIEARWPSGVVQKMENVRADRYIDLVEPDPVAPK